MTATAKDLYDELARIRYDLTAAQAKVTNVVNMLNALPIPDSEKNGLRCIVCGPVPFKTQRQLAEHLELVHGVSPGDSAA